MLKIDSKGMVINKSSKATLNDLVEKLNKKKMEVMVVVSWKLWQRRNGVVFKYVFTPPNTLVLLSHQLLKES